MGLERYRAHSSAPGNGKATRTLASASTLQWKMPNSPDDRAGFEVLFGLTLAPTIIFTSGLARRTETLDKIHSGACGDAIATENGHSDEPLRFHF